MTIRFIPACSVSLVLHAAVLGLPAGNLVPAFAPSSAPTGQAPARIQVDLLAPPAASHASFLAVTAPTIAPDAAPDRTPSQDRLPAHPAPESFGIPELRYYDPIELSRRARAIGDIVLPPGLERASDSGRLVLVLRIAATGMVDAVDIDQSTLEESLAMALAERFRRLRFHPAEIDGAAVNSRMKIEVLLRPPDV